jgi:8-oxo-dGTP pyrophosphatase MutT (NUDIX family)
MPSRFDDLRRGLEATVKTPRLGTTFAAVAVILREYQNTPQVLLIQRAIYPGDPWSGHLAFPGGRSEPSDQDLVATAVRETAEEVAVDLISSATLLGPLDPVPARGGHAAGLVVAPFVFLLHSEVAPVANPSEVERVFWADLDPLGRGQRNTTYQLNRGGAQLSFPGYQIDDRVLWGMTYHMLQPVLAWLCPADPSH